MASSVGWNNRGMFEHYLYDYFTKNNMHETAEIFRREANLSINPPTPPGLDVPGSFLHEWWLIFYDMFRAWEPKNPQDNEGSSYMAEQMMNMRQERDTSPSREHDLNEQMIRELTDSTDFGLTIGGNLVPSMRCPVIETERISYGLTSSWHQQKSMTATPVIMCPPGNLGDTVTQEIGSSVHGAPRSENIASNEECGLTLPGFDNHLLDSLWVAEQYKTVVLEKSILVESETKRKYSVDSEDGSSGVPEAANYPSETSTPTPNYLDDIAKPSPSHLNVNGDEGMTPSSNSQMHHSTPDTDDSKVHPVVESNRK